MDNRHPAVINSISEPVWCTSSEKEGADELKAEPDFNDRPDTEVAEEVKEEAGAK